MLDLRKNDARVLKNRHRTGGGAQHIVAVLVDALNERFARTCRGRRICRHHQVGMNGAGAIVGFKSATRVLPTLYVEARSLGNRFGANFSSPSKKLAALCSKATKPKSQDEV